MNKSRLLFIDNLRAFSLFGVMVIHIFSFHLTNSVTSFFWNYLQFVVVAFVFCSGIVSAHYESKLATFSSVLSWYKKRLGRLYMPFFVYFIIHFFLFFFFPNIFTHFGMQHGWSFFFLSLSLLGGINTNWLPLIFLQLTLLVPFVLFLKRKNLLWIFILVVGSITLGFTLFHFPYTYYRFVMWVPWSLILLLGLLYPQKSKGKFLLLLISISLYFVAFLFLLFQKRSILFYDNKYPPTFYYLGYGSFLTIIFSSFFSLITFPIFIQKLLSYISKNSYAIFFIHYIVLDFLESILLTNFYLLEIIIVPVISISIIGAFYAVKHFMIKKAAYSTSA